MDLRFNLAPSYCDLKHPTRRQNFYNTLAQIPKLILSLHCTLFSFSCQIGYIFKPLCLQTCRPPCRPPCQPPCPPLCRPPCPPPCHINHGWIGLGSKTLKRSQAGIPSPCLCFVRSFFKISKYSCLGKGLYCALLLAVDSGLARRKP